MSYDLSLYRLEFLRHAVEARLGDWTDPEPFPDELAEAIASHLARRGYDARSYPWLIGRCFAHPESRLNIEANLYKSSLVYSASYSPNAIEAAQVATSEAEAAAKLFGLAFIDPSSGLIIA